MIPSNEGKQVIDLALATTNATATHALSFDTKGSDQANFYLTCGSHNSATQGITSVVVAESDTVTSPSSMTTIAALSSGTSTSTSASNQLVGAAVMALGGVYQELQMDLRKRKRYVGITVTSGAVAAGMPICNLGRISRNEQSADSATEKDQPDLTATNVSGCMQVVSG